MNENSHLYHPYGISANVGVPKRVIVAVGPVWKKTTGQAIVDGWVFNQDKITSEFVYYFTITLNGRNDPLRIIQPYDSEELQLTDEGAYNQVKGERDQLLAELDQYWGGILSHGN